MNRIAVRDIDIGVNIPVHDPENWTLVKQLFSTAIVMDGFIERHVAIHELREAGIWRSDWDTLPEIPDGEDERCIVENQDRCH